MLEDIDGPNMEDYGFIHRDDLPDLDNLKDHLEGVAEAFYKSGDTDYLERCLDECFHILGMKLEAAPHPAVERCGNRNIMMYHIGYQRAQIDQMRREKCVSRGNRNPCGSREC
jgi:hypothetical protein